jgi:hypothetical protein
MLIKPMNNFTKNLILDAFGDKVAENNLLIELALKKLSIIDVGSVLISYNERCDWYRSGTETYSGVSEITFFDKDKMNRNLIFIGKALITLGVPISINLSRWNQRRRHLSKYFDVPVLFSQNNGVLYEEFVTSQYLDEGYHNISKHEGHLIQLADICATLDFLGYAPVSIVPNLIFSPDRAVWVDFGEDLGDASGVYQEGAIDILEREIPKNEKAHEILGKSYRKKLKLLRS